MPTSCGFDGFGVQLRRASTYLNSIGDPKLGARCFTWVPMSPCKCKGIDIGPHVGPELNDVLLK
jgi:hypothetical protein